MIKRNIGLTVLDAYAKRLSSKQVGMLYENRLHKKYQKSLFESLTQNDREDIEDSFSLSVSIAAANEVGISKTDLIVLLSNIDRDVNYKVTQNNIYFYTILPDVFKEMKNILTDNDIVFNETSNE